MQRSGSRRSVLRSGGGTAAPAVPCPHCPVPSLPRLTIPAAIGVLLVAALPAKAPPREPQEPTPRLQGYPHDEAAPAGSWFERSHLTGDWGGLRSWLQARGITPELFSTTDASLVVAGGRNPSGTALRTLVDATLGFASEPLLGYRGGTLFVDLQVQRGSDGSDDTGDLQRYSDIDHTHGFAQVAMLWYEQALADDTLWIKVGKNDVNSDFDVVEHGAHFVHPSFGHSPNLLAMPTYPDTAFGAQVRWQPGTFRAGAGVYDGAALRGVRTGERGPRTLFGQPDDLFAIAEVGAAWGGPQAGRCSLGGFRHTGEFARFDGGSDNGTQGLYATLDQQLWRVGDGDDGRGVAGCLMYGWADPMLSPIGHHVGAGLAWCGPWAQRPRDVVGLGASYAAFSKEPGAGLAGDGELAIEAFYELRATPWLQCKPVLSWIRDPGGAAGVDDAWVLTLRTAITF